MSETPDPSADSAQSADGTEAPLDFDPYRFGAPEHPIPPEYAPPGYKPPVPQLPPPPDPASAYPPAYPPPAAQYPGYPPPSAQYPGYPQQPYQPGPGYPPLPPNYNAQYPSPRTGNGRATAGLVLGIASIALCWLVIIDFVVIALGIIFSILGRTAAVREPHLGGRRSATAGLACSIAGLVLSVIILVLAVHAVQQCNYLPQSTTAWNDCVQHHLHLK
jgi:hypothetical protein